MKKQKKMVVIVTGASSGIGRAIAEEYAENGHVVYGCGRREAEGLPFNYFQCDVTDGAAFLKKAAEIYEKEGRIDLFCAAAGMGISGSVEHTEDAAVSRLVTVDFLAVEQNIRAVLPFLISSKGKLLTVGSIAGEIAIPFQSYYSAMKAAVENLTQALDPEIRPYGARAVCLLPGDVKTGFTAVREKNAESGRYAEREKRSVAGMEKDERNGMAPEKIARAAYRVMNRKNPPVTFTVGVKYKLIRVLCGLLPRRFVRWVIYGMYAK